MRLGLDERRDAFRVLEDEFQRIAREASVDGHRNRACPHGAEEDLEEFDAVADDHADALAGLYAASPQESRHPVGALVELRVGDAALRAAVEVDDRDLLREPLDRRREEIAEVSVSAHRG